MLATLAIRTDKNEVDTVVSEIIVDCTNRVEFEELLVRLELLQHRDLIRVQQMLESCGPFYSQRKAVMITRLERELEALRNRVNLLSVLHPRIGDFNLSNWEEVVSLERRRSDLLSEQVAIQREIVSFLISGKKSSAVEIRERVGRAGEVFELLGVLDKQIDAKRDVLIS